MKLKHWRRGCSAGAPQKPRVLVPLMLGSIALHLIVWWAIARFSAASAKAPEDLIEVQLSDLAAPPKPQTAPAIRSDSRVAKAPRAPRPAQIPLVRRASPTPPTPPRRAIAPLTRSTRAISETGVVAKKPNVAQTIVAPATAQPQAQNPVIRPSRAPDTIVPQPRKPAPATETRADKVSSLPDAGESRNQTSKKERKSNPKSGAKNEKGINLGKGAASSHVGRLKTGEGPRPTQTQPDKPAPLSDVGDGQNQGNRGASSQGKRENSGAGNGSGGDQSGAGGGPFGVNDGAGEGPRRIVYILDISFSMEPRFERAKKELRDALGALQSGESFNIIAFYGNVKPFSPRLVEATPRNIDKGRDFIDSLRLSRYTNLERAFEATFAAPDVNVVVLITDGVPTYGLGSPDFSEDNPNAVVNISANFGELAQRVRQLNRFGARIYTIGLAEKNPDGSDERFEAAGLLQRIATESGGIFKTVRIDAAPQSDSRN